MIVEDPRIARPPKTEEYSSDKLYIEYFVKDYDFFVHLYKPVEKLIREEERKIRDTGIAPWPEYKDVKKREIQKGIVARIDKCEARRQAWRETPMARWPNLGEKLESVVIDLGLGNFSGSIEFIKEADSWCIALRDAYRITKDKQMKLMKMIDEKISPLLDWPEEENA
jgi:hypothetical protein